MPTHKLVAEADLQSWAICPLTSPPADDTETSCARQTLNWALLEAHNNLILTPEVLRARYIKEWNTFWPSKQEREKSAEYWQGVRLGSSFAQRVRQFLLGYEVLHPVEKYYLSFGGHTIIGSYSLVRRRAGKDIPMVLVWHRRRSPQAGRPDLLSVARYVNAMMSGQHLDVGIYHLPVFRDNAWKQRGLRETLAHQWLRSILDSMQQDRRFPAPGGHCANCSTKVCMEVFDVRQDDDCRKGWNSKIPDRR